MPGSRIEPLAVDGNGNVLIAFSRDAEDAPPDDAPLPLSLVALWHHDSVLLVFDRRRHEWELPGGIIEPAESPRQTASRELLEETGQEADAPLWFAGYAKFTLQPDRRVEYGALFIGNVARPKPFRDNEEVSAFRWWDPRGPLPEGTDSLDLHLARLVMPSRHREGQGNPAGKFKDTH
ncbi:DNA mismatch repair protein MutT [Streptomyces minutiscleroticus]|uniref:DNA mismatch repair protein MutT n=1 Tax=Streptomyces minutiscleroticus TaxID=68238 RepID=A0A918U9Z7_9ACTN|nr:NUDIX domain-containing protein [Streptomyces minutiscleroticus]GGY15472.1 DNA mismatch repair protein MutT [Streptomyces minutiscleroticus]